MIYAISTHLYHDQRLSREHLAEIAAHGFEAVEVFATRTHFDYHDPDAIARLAEWLKDTGLALHGVHAPVAESVAHGDQWGKAISNAVSDTAKQRAAVREADAALNIVPHCAPVRLSEIGACTECSRMPLSLSHPSSDSMALRS